MSPLFQSEITSLTEDIKKTEQALKEQEDEAAAAVAAATSSISPVRLSDELECPVCLELPTSGIFCCQKCNNMVCGKCKGRLPHCPQCRVDFEARPPQRNVLMERTFKLN